MQQQQVAAAPAGGAGDADGRKAKLLALLDRARVNRGLQPEELPQSAGGRPESTHHAVSGDWVQRPTSPQQFKVENVLQNHADRANGSHTRHERLDSPASGTDGELRRAPPAPKCTCGHAHQTSAVASPRTVDAHKSRRHDRDQGFLLSMVRGAQGSDDIVIPVGSLPSSTSATMQATLSHPIVYVTDGTSSPAASAMLQTAGESSNNCETLSRARQRLEPHHHVTNGRLAVLNPTTTASQPHTADISSVKQETKLHTATLTSFEHDPPLLKQLKPLQVPRHPAQHPEPVVTRELPARAQSKQHKQPREDASTATAAAFKKLALLTPEEYEDSELHGDFRHMVQLLVPSNATAALLERRGQPIREICLQSDCTLSLREPEASPFKDDRVLRIYGKAKGICLAQRLVIARIRAFRAEKRDPNYMDLTDEAPPVALPATSITKAMSVAVASNANGKKKELELTNPFNWMVEREDVGKMMGRQGAILASIRQNSGASIHVDEDVVAGTTERRVTLGGSLASIASAMEEIKSRAGGRPEVSATVSNGRLGQYFAVPYRAAGFLIGPQGATVKSITERTGARLQIPAPEDLPLGSFNRILHMQGTPKQTEHARRVVGGKLRDFLAASHDQNALAAASTGRKGDLVTVKVLLSARICGFMLDQHGQLIREISEKSGAYARFLAPHANDCRVCVFSGDMSCVFRAQRLVLQVVAGDAISSKRIAPPRKRKRPQEEDYEEEEEEELLYEDEEEVAYYEEYEELPRLPARRQPVRRQAVTRPRRDYEEYGGAYDYEEEELEPLRQPPVRRQPVRRRRQFAGDEYEEEDEEVVYEVRPRPLKRQTIRRRQPVSFRRSDYDDESESDGQYEEQPRLARQQTVRRQTVSTRFDGPRRIPVVRPGRKVQMVAPRSSPREGRPRAPPADRRRPSDHASTRPTTNRGGRVAASRGRGNANKRRRQ